MEKQTFEIPKGCSKVTVEQVGNTIVTTFESEKYIPKVGDCVKVNFEDYISFVHVKKVDDDKVRYYVLLDEDGSRIKTHDWYDAYYCCEQITTEELQAEFNKLGYEYDFETHTAKKLRFKPEYGEIYYTVLNDCTIDNDIWHNDNIDNSRFKIGNCYRTQEEAEPRRQHYLSFKD